jgi:hypothetical protein
VAFLPYRAGVVDFGAARDFVQREARILEQRVAATLFENAGSDGVVAAVAAYANEDGGLGHGLEPDVRCPSSQPLFVSFGLDALVSVGAAPRELLAACCRFLAGVAHQRGAVPMLLPPALDYPHAAHWDETAYPPHPTMTIGIAAALHELGFRHPWLDRATDYALAEFDREPPDEAHLLRYSLRLAVALDDSARLERLASAIPAARWFKSDPASTDYGVTPLQMAPSPQFARKVFNEDLLDAHLDALEAEQQPDGGWELAWEPPSDASRLEWRGVRTVEAVRLLRAYGRLDV